MSQGIGVPELSVPHLVDSTVWSKARSRSVPGISEWFNRAVHDELVHTCDVVVLELLRSARSPQAYEEQAALLALLICYPTDVAISARARAVQGLLAARSPHPGVQPADLLIAATAELVGLPLLHYDRDYDRIGSMTGQQVRWVAPTGTLP